MGNQPDTFVLYRIIGNDLPPRHTSGQSRKNLAFILEHEAHLPGCEKRFVVNRIVDRREERAILQLLEEAGAACLHIPFESAAYRRVSWDIEGVPVEYAPWTKRFANLSTAEQGRVLMRLYRHKNNHVMNNNGARNAALREGREIAKWVLPWDGNCFITTSAWSEIVAAVRANLELLCFVVPMARISDNTQLFGADFRPEVKAEPQIFFRRDAAVEFDPAYYYGRRPKVELFWRLGVPGSWDAWLLEPWDLPCPPYAKEASAFGYAGWVARLFSGQRHLEDKEGPTSLSDRGLARVAAIRNLLDDLDDDVSKAAVEPEPTTTIAASDPSPDRTGAAIAARLREAADEALLRGPYSVMDKTSLPPSGDPHDYWHPAPYYWPHPLRLPFLPYVPRDGRRVPGTKLYEPLSEKYDRTRLQRLFDDTFVLTLAWRVHGDRRHAEHAAALVRTWFLERETATNPNLDYAQVRRGYDGNRGSSSGIIEMKDLYFFLDAVRLLSSAGWLLSAERASLQDWFAHYLRWLRTSLQGREERTATNNHGTCYDLQVTAIAAFLGENRLVRETLRDSRSRILQQFDAAGVQPAEMKRTNTAHYCCFNLQAWINLAQLAQSLGEDLWSFEGRDGRGIRRAMQWLLSHVGQRWRYPQIDAFDSERFYPVYHACLAHYGDVADVDVGVIPSVGDIKPIFFPHDGIRPFWQLGSLDKVKAFAGKDARRRG